MRTTKNIIATAAIALGFLSALNANAEKIDLLSFGTSGINVDFSPTAGTHSLNASSLGWSIADMQGSAVLSGSPKTDVSSGLPDGIVNFTEITLSLTFTGTYEGGISIAIGNDSDDIGGYWVFTCNSVLDVEGGLIVLTYNPDLSRGVVDAAYINYFAIQLHGQEGATFNATFNELYTDSSKAIVRVLEFRSDDPSFAGTISFPKTKGDATVTIYSDSVLWTATKNASWITLGAVTSGGETSGPDSKDLKITVPANSGKARVGIITVTGGGVTRTLRVEQGGDIFQPSEINERDAIRTEYTVYETKISARTSTIRELKVKCFSWLQYGQPNATPADTATIHYRMPVTKNYTILMAYSGQLGETSKGYGRMWAPKERVIELRGGEGLMLNGRDAEGNYSFIGAKMTNIPESGTYTVTDGSNATVNFDGLATVNWKLGIIASSTGFVYGENFMPLTCALANCPDAGTNPDQGDTPVASQLQVVNLYYPQKCATSSASSAPSRDTHFFGTYTTRHNAKLSNAARGKVTGEGEIDISTDEDFWDSAKTLIDKNVKGGILLD